MTNKEMTQEKPGPETNIIDTTPIDTPVKDTMTQDHQGLAGQAQDNQGGAGQKTKAKGNRVKNTLLLIRSMKPYGYETIFTLVCAFLKHVSTLASAGIVAYMVGLAMEGELAGRFWGLFGWLCAGILTRATMYYGEMWFGHDVAYRVLKDFRINLYSQVDKISPAYQLKHHTGNIGSTLIADVEILEWFLAHTFGTAVVAIVFTAFVLVLLALVNLPLAAMTLVFGVLVAYTPFFLYGRADAQGKDIREKLARANVITLEGVHGLRELLTLNQLDNYKEKYKKATQALYDSQLTYGRRQGTENLLMSLLVGFFTVAVMGLGAGMVADGTLDFKLYPVTILLGALLFSPILEICGAARNLGIVFAAANRVQNVLNALPVVKDLGTVTDSSNLDPEVRFEKVSFHYLEGEPAALKDVSFEVKKGLVTALVGPSGAGKTTCANLLLRYWDRSNGSVTIGGEDIKNLSFNALHDLVCAVPQEIYLFNVSVRENIRLGKPEASDLEVESAAKAAFAHDFIMGLPNGYDTLTGERGFNLSGGQRQRIAIARAFLKNTPIIILDEAVSNLDTENEFYIQKTIKTMVNQKTILLVAHRLSTIMAADQLIVLNQGRLVQSGSPQDLIAQDGFFKDLVNGQITKEGFVA
ncbi:MAG: ABC transporter ATP-binding protein/permease [Deltaproteobacteria bacterium]|jgi:ABC-type multidrug transport system fused ATPase/permease subunit|nr:ABC transporter ATP-binding protein/permease [Deltaproteobacteria bacterium]